MLEWAGGGQVRGKGAGASACGCAWRRWWWRAAGASCLMGCGAAVSAGAKRGPRSRTLVQAQELTIVPYYHAPPRIPLTSPAPRQAPTTCLSACGTWVNPPRPRATPWPRPQSSWQRRWHRWISSSSSSDLRQGRCCRRSPAGSSRGVPAAAAKACSAAAAAAAGAAGVGAERMAAARPLRGPGRACWCSRGTTGRCSAWRGRTTEGGWRPAAVSGGGGRGLCGDGQRVGAGSGYSRLHVVSNPGASPRNGMSHTGKGLKGFGSWVSGWGCGRGCWRAACSGELTGRGLHEHAVPRSCMALSPCSPVMQGSTQPPAATTRRTLAFPPLPRAHHPPPDDNMVRIWDTTTGEQLQLIYQVGFEVH